MPNSLNKFTKLSRNLTMFRFVPSMRMSSKKLYINIGPCMG